MGEPIVRNHPQGKMKQNYKGKEAGKFVQMPVLDPTPDRITKLGMARTFQNIRLWKSQTVFDNVLIAKHMLRTSNVFSATFPSQPQGGGAAPRGGHGASAHRGPGGCEGRAGDVSALRQAAPAGDRPRAGDASESF